MVILTGDSVSESSVVSQPPRIRARQALRPRGPPLGGSRLDKFRRRSRQSHILDILDTAPPDTLIQPQSSIVSPLISTNRRIGSEQIPFRIFLGELPTSLSLSKTCNSYHNFSVARTNSIQDILKTDAHSDLETILHNGPDLE